MTDYPRQRACVFCGSSGGTRPSYTEAARSLGRALVRSNLELVYGGGNSGMMGELADSVLASGGRVTGIIPRFFMSQSVAHRGLSELRVVETMQERKAMMMELSDVILALPGGIGTFEELLEAHTLIQLGLLKRPIGLLNVDGFFDTLLKFLDETVAEGFLRSDHRKLLIVGQSPESLLECLRASRVT